MIRALTVLFLAISTVCAHAQTVTLRSADHAGFSRLVVDLPSGTQWTFGKSGDAYEFRSGIDDLTFDASNVFVRMTKDRITQVTPMDRGRLQVRIAETYHADVFELRDGQIVIDIKDGDPDPNSEYEVALEPFLTDVVPQPPVASNSAPAADAPTPTPTPTPTVERSRTGEFDFAGLGRFGRTQISDVTDSVPQPDEPQPEKDAVADVGDLAATKFDRDEFVRQLEQNLIEQIGRASADGLLVPALPDVDKTERIIDEAQGSDAEPDTPVDVDVAQPEMPTETDTHLKIESATDRAQKTVEKPRRNFAVDGSECIATTRLDMATWGLPLDEEFELPRLRAQLIDELDVPRQEGVLDLARYYLFLTYGAEAKSVLKFLPEEDPDLPLLLVLADIFEESYADESGPLLDQQSCDTAASLWSVMATQSLSKGQDYNRAAIIAAFNVLPHHLRRVIGPDLARRFAEIGDTQTAAQIKSVFTRTAPLEGTDVLLMDASIAESQSDQERSDELVLEVVENHSHEKPQTLIDFVKDQREKDAPVTVEVADTAETIAVEYRHHVLEEALVEASIVARILTGDIDRALAQLNLAETAKRVSEEGAVDLRKLALAESIDSQSDNVFLKAVFRNIDFMEAHMKDDASLGGVSTRLFDLGFADAAQRLGNAMPQSQGESATDDHRALVSGDWTELLTSENPSYATLAKAVVTQPSILTETPRAPDLFELETLLTDIKSKRESVLELLSK
ncbi:MAG: hypothetical protein ABF266_04795 [Celeribacter marinus]